MKQKHVYSIWFDQVNQTRFEITAETKEAAIQVAIREWNTAYSSPMPSEVVQAQQP